MTSWVGFEQLGLNVAHSVIAKRHFALKRILITGASSGIGRACAIWLLNQGARVALVGRDIVKLREIGEQFPNQAISVQCDLAVDKEQYDMVASVIDSFGGLDILLNCAGIAFENDLQSTYPQDHDYLIDINLRAIYHITQLCQQFLMKSRGCVVNLSAEWGHRPQQGMISYCISKTGLEMLTKCLALELPPARVNAVAPGYIQTAFYKNAGLSDNEVITLEKRMREANPMRRIGLAEEAARAVLFLCSKHAQSVNGHVLTVDGGQHLTSSITCRWNHSNVMDKKFAPTGEVGMKRVVTWFSKELGKVVREEVEDAVGWAPVARSNWGTSMADAHAKIGVPYDLLDEEEEEDGLS